KYLTGNSQSPIYDRVLLLNSFSEPQHLEPQKERERDRQTERQTEDYCKERLIKMKILERSFEKKERKSCPADKPEIKPTDEILEVNGWSVRNCTREFLTRYIKQ
ncbi:hypothetical protein BgiBS90_014783, partial [Biomphalaria glabrata]